MASYLGGPSLESVAFIKWLNAMNICKRVKTVDDFRDGKIFFHLANLIKDNKGTPTSQECGDAFTIAERYDVSRSVVDEYFRLNSSLIIDFERIVTSDYNEVIKFGILLLTAVTLFYSFDDAKKHIIFPLYYLPMNDQTFIHDCVDCVIEQDNELNLRNILRTLAEKKRSVPTPKVWQGRLRRKISHKRFELDESPPMVSGLPPLHSTLQQFMDSPNLRYKVHIKKQKRENNQLQACLNKKDEKLAEMTRINDNLQVEVSERGEKIKELQNEVCILAPFRDLVQINDGQQLEMNEKLTFLEKKYKCPNCIEHSEVIKRLNEDIMKILEEKENLLKEMDILKSENDAWKESTKNLKSIIQKLESDNKKIQDMKLQIENFKFTSNLYKKNYEVLLYSRITPIKDTNSPPERQAESSNESKEDTKEKIEKGSSKSSTDKNALKVKELQMTISELKEEIKKKNKEIKNTRKEIDHITAQYGSSLEKEKALQAEVDDLKAKSLDQREGCNETSPKFEPSPQKRNSSGRTGSAKRKKSNIQLQDDPIQPQTKSMTDELSLLKRAVEDQSHDHFQEQITLMQQENENLQREREVVLKQKSEIEKLETYSSQLSAELETLKQNYQTLKIEKEMSEKDARVKTVILKENCDQMRQEKEERDIKLSERLEEIRNKLLMELEKFQQKSVEMENLEKQMAEQLASQEQEIKSNKLFINLLTERNSVLTNQFQVLTKCMKEKEKNYNKKINEFENTNNKLNSKLEDINEKLEKTENQRHELSIYLEESDQKLNQLMKNNEECEQLNKKLIVRGPFFFIALLLR